ncbi:acyl-CoA reductase-like NAD-dependent aldehyde dehydrogenase [Bradyrhizobium sp. GM0.4]
MSEHPDIDMMSFTGSTRAGIDVARRAALTVKRVSQELGGKSPYIVLDDADLEKAVSACIETIFLNSGQSCDAPSRLIVPNIKMEEVTKIAKNLARKYRVGHPRAAGIDMGPVVNRGQWEKIPSLDPERHR